MALRSGTLFSFDGKGGGFEVPQLHRYLSPYNIRIRLGYGVHIHVAISKSNVMVKQGDEKFCTLLVVVQSY